MNDQSPKDSCPRCNGEFEEGFIVGGIPPHFGQAEWVAGAPTFTFGKGVSGSDKTKRVVKTLRCTGCGYLESYAE